MFPLYPVVTDSTINSTRRLQRSELCVLIVLDVSTTVIEYS